MGIFNIFKKDKNNNLRKQQEKIKNMQEVANEINANYEINTSNIVFTNNDKLRIDKNCRVMESLGLPFLKEMKLIPLDSNVKIKTKELIAAQMIYSIIVGHKAMNKLNNISDTDDMNFMSLAFKFPIQEMYLMLGSISNGEIDEVTLNQYAYLYEQANVYAYILGLKSKPSEVNLSDERNLHDILINNENFNDLINKCNMISYEQIMEYSDLVTRYEWAMIELKRLNQTSNNINSDCVIEHKKAVDFVTSFNPQIYLERK